MKSNEKILLLKKEFDENKNSHVFLVETDDTAKSICDIKSLLKLLISQDENTSIQIDNETYLELIIVRPEGKEIKKDAIIDLQGRLKMKPVLSRYIFYIISPAESLNLISANKLLKTIEEPNENVIGFLITTNADLLLPTLKSRCELLSVMYKEYLTDIVDDKIHEITKALIEAIEKNDHVQYFKTKLNEKIIKDNFKIVENLIKSYYNTACNLTKGANIDQILVDSLRKNNSYEVLIKKATYLNKTFNKLTDNMNDDLLLEKIFLDLKGVN